MLDLSALSVLSAENGITWWRCDKELSCERIVDLRVAKWFHTGDVIATGKYLWRVTSIRNETIIKLELFFCKTCGRNAGTAEMIEPADHQKQLVQTS